MSSHYWCSSYSWSNYELQLLCHILKSEDNCFSKNLVQVWNCYEYEHCLLWVSWCKKDWKISGLEPSIQTTYSAPKTFHVHRPPLTSSPTASWSYLAFSPQNVMCFLCTRFLPSTWVTLLSTFIFLENSNFPLRFSSDITCPVKPCNMPRGMSFLLSASVWP